MHADWPRKARQHREPLFGAFGIVHRHRDDSLANGRADRTRDIDIGRAAEAMTFAPRVQTGVVDCDSQCGVTEILIAQQLFGGKLRRRRIDIELEVLFRV